MSISYQWYRFEQLTTAELYCLLRIRQEVFVVEQNCAYLDCDNLDQQAHHLIAWRNKPEQKEAVACLRLLPPGVYRSEFFPAGREDRDHDRSTLVTLGRLLTTGNVRGMGIGREMMLRALEHCGTMFPQTGVRISAQEYLSSFYQRLGFEGISGQYLEDGIPHIEMMTSARPETVNNKLRSITK
jgi:ElaA protein